MIQQYSHVTQIRQDQDFSLGRSSIQEGSLSVEPQNDAPAIIEGEDFILDYEQGTILALKDFGNYKYKFTYDFDDSYMENM